MSRQTQAIIHADAIIHNFKLLSAMAPQSTSMAVIKADAYGHGAVNVARILQHVSPHFAVAIIESAEAVRNITEILTAPLSAIMVVPGDMSIDLGLGPPGAEIYPEVDAAFQTVLKACMEQDIVVCGCGDGRSRIPRRLDEGWQFVLPLGG